MTNKTLAVVLSAALLLPTLGLAEVQVVNGEAGMIFNETPSTTTREQVRAELRAGTAMGDQHFKYVGGEAGWNHESPTHRMVMENGRLVHAFDCPVMASMNVPKPKGPNARLPSYYSGA